MAPRQLTSDLIGLSPMKFVLLAISAMLATPACATIYLHADPGGMVDEYADNIAAIGDEQVVIDGECNSACTMYLSAPNVCVTPSARLGFHSAYYPKHDGSRGATSQLGTHELWSHYPAGVR
jgi:hypothetical protein